MLRGGDADENGRGDGERECAAERQRELVCEYATSLRVSGGGVSVTDIAGNETTVEGSILSIDLIRNTVLIGGR
jgi:predicted RNA-binding protein